MNTLTRQAAAKSLKMDDGEDVIILVSYTKQELIQKAKDLNIDNWLSPRFVNSIAQALADEGWRAIDNITEKKLIERFGDA